MSVLKCQPKYLIRKARSDDSMILFEFIKELAAYEQLEESVIGSPKHIQQTLFGDNPLAEAIILEQEGLPAGFALYFHNYSTFLCRYGIYVEDIYVRDKFRGKGYGKALLTHICKVAMERDCGRVKWWCLDWNKPSIDFYLSLGAQAMTDWTVYRLNRSEIESMVEKGECYV